MQGRFWRIELKEIQAIRGRTWNLKTFSLATQKALADELLLVMKSMKSKPEIKFLWWKFSPVLIT